MRLNLRFAGRVRLCGVSLAFLFYFWSLALVLHIHFRGLESLSSTASILVVRSSSPPLPSLLSLGARMCNLSTLFTHHEIGLLGVQHRLTRTPQDCWRGSDIQAINVFSSLDIGHKDFLGLSTAVGAGATTSS